MSSLTKPRSDGNSPAGKARPHVSLIVVSHNKPKYVRQAIQGVLDQTHRDWEAVVIDSGVLLNQGFFEYLKDPRIRIIASGETPEISRTKNMASWCYNQCLNSGKVNGELIMYLCDDDLIYPETFETFWNFYVENDRVPQAMYASQEIGLVDEKGQNQVIGRRIADRPAGRFCKGRRLDSQVDGLQFCHTAWMLEKLREVYHTSEYHNEDRRHAHHADGIFMEQIGLLTKVYNIDKMLSMNRRTVESINLQYSTSPVGRAFITFREKLKGAWELISRGRPY
jgi:spore maturation protein CgeD